MPLGFELAVAWRFLREGRFQSVLILIGVAAGVAVVTYISALVIGLQGNTIKRTLGVQPHISVRPPEDRVRAPNSQERVAEQVQPRAQRTRSIDNWGPLLSFLEDHPQVSAVSPMASGAGLALRGEARRAIGLIGVDLDRYDRIVALKDRLIAGKAVLGPGEAILGKELAADLGATIGDLVLVSTGRSALDGSPIQETFRIVALYDFGIRDVNRRNVYVSLRAAQSLLGLPGGVTSIDLTVEDIFHADKVAASIRQSVDFEVESWMETNSQLLSALNAQSISTQLIRGVVLVVVVLGIASVLAVSVVQKGKEIGILRAMGATRGQITRVFVLQGAVVGLFGSVLGGGLAAAMVYAFTHLVKGADGKPLFVVSVEPSMVVVISLIATVCGVLAALAPARRAARLDPAQAIRS